MILLVGAGPMAVQYANVLNGMGRPFQVVGRSAQSAAAFHAAVGVQPTQGGIEAYFEGEHPAIQFAIVAVSVEQLEHTSTYLLEKGVKHLLIEKPGGLTLESIERLKQRADAAGASIYIAYNRRFLSSVLKARELIEEDGGVTSFAFEITEWSDTIRAIPKADGVKENWFFANTTHVTDLAFYLGGRPRQLSTFTSGTLDWHNRAARFTGAGETHEGALFSYSGDWEAPGRWVVEVLTRKRRFIFKPLEKLQVQVLNSVAVAPVEVDATLDSEYKPGLYLQVEHFLTGNQAGLCPLAEHLENSRLYARIAGYA
ncbi:myo-inositol 2-dehydrogenase [Pseudomonas sp. SDI]|uniref:Gfo/Idh/MocA family oxidoreductase n=1 Tax=Pseudomonas sp. SDI TaxID=2170734 RepID=UPI000DE5E10C|nr:Gfo/Idh/MocA family oxidoreductase [Pseudomonas sp. SDI]PWB36014.1 myo-inositol 2-dehydrogenase [Pseudomonas sp. SDI]